MIKFTSLFANAGIGTFLAKEVGCECSVANESLLGRQQLHQNLHGKDCRVVFGDINDDKVFNEVVRLHKERGCVGVMQTAPCQSFSLAGGQHLDDEEALLFKRGLQFIKETEPEWIFFENVPYFISDDQLNKPEIIDKLDGKTVKQYIYDFLESLNLGYIGNHGILDASYFGNPQGRERAILLFRKGKKWEFPKPDEKRMTVRDAMWNRFMQLEPKGLGTWRDPENRFHFAAYVELNQAECLRRTPTGKSALQNPEPWKIKTTKGNDSQAQHENSAYCRIKWDSPCPTIRQSSDNLGDDRTIHPGYELGKDENGIQLYSDPRPLSLAEIFVLTGLPQSFNDAIPDWAVADEELLRQVIGEALMPQLANRILAMLEK